MVDTIFYNLQRKPESKKGYVLGARTAPRFPPLLQAVGPSPQKYQKDWTLSTLPSPGRVPFSSSTPRFRSSATHSFIPGPGTYDHNTPRNRKVIWPAKFGSPDWSGVPLPKMNTLRVELPTSKEFCKQRNRVAYLRLYYS